ncbi:MAG: hypothetical protein YSLV7_ORF07 [Yellowstone Lake virophage 7]|uniref:hypothetical protein n=1 Tax=Yellowstone Lake virophage 7 TaxID=1557035 RepID=UPI0005363DE2|nr:MAG: hypothetical protein ASQ67_gp07 [Yellowstone Lake virophage 7]AIW01926.1 MAG: hypothetical protein YSLV7_ORF07 [Yellowstone Lake virophage 7]
MAEVFTEIIVIRKYKFCDEIWEMIKNYMGLYGIDLRLPDIMAKISNDALYQSNRFCFGQEKCPKTGSQRKTFYNNLRLDTLDNYISNEARLRTRKSLCDSLIYRYNKELFKIPEGLKIGETILLFKYYVFEKDSEIGIVSKINTSSFTVKVYENNKHSHTRIIKKNGFYLRKIDATENELRYFIKYKTGH